MKMQTMYDRIYDGHVNHVNANSGDRFHDTFTLGFDSDGKRVLKKHGRIDVYSEIQSHAQSVDIHNIIDRFNNGDLAVLDNAKGYYVDLTQFPRTYAEMVQRMQDAEEYFNALPVDVRAKYNHSVTEFIVAMSDSNVLANQSVKSEKEVVVHEEYSAE